MKVFFRRRNPYGYSGTSFPIRRQIYTGIVRHLEADGSVLCACISDRYSHYHHAGMSREAAAMGRRLLCADPVSYTHLVGGKEESVTKVNKSNYKATPRTITVGIAGDPELSNELQAAIATQDEATVNATLASCVARMQQ